jgi:hypothetical protein
LAGFLIGRRALEFVLLEFVPVMFPPLFAPRL